MDRQRWETIKDILDCALELPLSERESFVRTASNGDPEVLSGVMDLLGAEQRAGDFLQSPIRPESMPAKPTPALPPFKPGEVVCQRFRIVRLVGEGGMGHVFEAWDTELGVRVALKSIRPEIAENAESLERFRREVRLALQITNPNVCRTFDIERESRILDADKGTRVEILLLTMEFLEGETLAEKLARIGPLPLNEALSIARQIAAALSSAHEFGIVHRDIKPANIMLVPVQTPSGSSATSLAQSGQPRAVITDFGLARQEAVFKAGNHTTVSRAGLPIGTLAYMAPEQLVGDQTTPATDIYAFGLVLFEMATGRRAFTASNALASISERLNGPAPSPHLIVPTLPAPWRRAIEGCLRATPSDRFQSAQDVLAVLEGKQVKLPRAASRSIFRQIFAQTLRRPRLVAATFLAAVSLFVLGLRLYVWKANPRVDPGALVYLTQVKNQTGEKAFDNLTQLVQSGLTQSVQINLLDQARVGDTLQQMTKSPDATIDDTVAREIALRTGAVRVIFATVAGSSGNYSLNIDIQQPDPASPKRYRDHWAKSFAWRSMGTTGSTIPPELLVTIRNSSDWIRRETGESKNDIARLDVPPEDVTTDNWNALSEFVAAEGMQRRRATLDAIVALQDVVRIDPKFSLAWARLADLLIGAGRYQEGYRAYSQALSLDQEQRLTLRERDRIKGAYALDSGDFATAEAAYRDYEIYYENDYRGWFYRGYPLLMLGRTDEAIQALKRAYAIDPTRGNAPWELARAYTAQGNLDEALHWATVLRQLGDSGNSSYLEGVVHFLRHEYPEAARSFASIQLSAFVEHHSWSYLLTARLYAEQGNYPQALISLDDGIHEDKSRGYGTKEAGKLMAKAYIEGNLGEYDKCAQDVASGLSLDDSPQALLTASTVLGRSLTKATGPSASGLRHLLVSLEKKLPTEDLGVIFQVAGARVRGEVFLANGNAQDAIKEFRKAVELDSPLNSREYLGRALEIAAKSEADPGRALDLRKESMGAYAAAALRPNLAWLDPNGDMPGSYADQLASWLRLAIATHSEESATQSSIRELAGLRGRGALTAKEFQITPFRIHPESSPIK